MPHQYQPIDLIRPLLHMAYAYQYKIEKIKELLPAYCGFLNTKAPSNYPEKYKDIAEEILIRFWTVMYSKSMTLNLKIVMKNAPAMEFFEQAL